MQHVATLKYDELLVARAVRSFWLRSMGWRMIPALFVLVALFGYRLAAGDRSWFVGLLGGVAALGLLMPAAVYWIHYRNCMTKLRDMGSPVGTLVADDASFTLSSDAGSSILKWNAVKEIWRFDKFWLLLFSKAQFATIPLGGVSAEMQSFVVDRVLAAGGSVR